MTVDPTDDCTFWFTEEYEKVTGSFNWSTAIGTFRFPGCSGGGGPLVTLVPTSLTWGKVVVGKTVGPKTVTLTNSGSATLNNIKVAISGDFSLKTVKTSCANGSTVAAGKTCVFKVLFKPSQTGLRTGDITITDNAPDSPQTVPLKGTGK